METGAFEISDNEQSQARVILFDLDGTLIDHFSAIHRAVSHAQAQLGLPTSDYATVRATVGGSVPITLGKLCGGADAAARAEPYFRQHFAEIMLEDVKPLPGAGDLLQRLKSLGMTLAVLTNKYDAHAKAVLAHLGMDTWLDGILGTDGELPYRKPDPRFTMQALEALDCASEDCLLVGDSPYDFATAEAACLPCHLIATGSHSLQQLAEETSADGIHQDLPAFAESYFGLVIEA